MTFCSFSIILKHSTAIKGIQKQPSRGALRKRCSENMQQIYRRTPMPIHLFPYEVLRYDEPYPKLNRRPSVEII